MAAPEEWRHPDVWHLHRLHSHKPTTSPPKDAYILTTLGDHSHKAKTLPTKRSSNQKTIQNLFVADLPNIPSSGNLKTLSQLSLIVLTLPLPSAPTHTCLHSFTAQWCGVYVINIHHHLIPDT